MADEDLRKWLSQGGQRRIRFGDAAETHDVDAYGDRVEDSRSISIVSDLLSPKLDLAPEERAIGNCYGAYYELANTGGGGSEFLREFVDGGGGSGGGFSEKQAMIVSMVLEAQRVLNTQKVVTYPIAAPRKVKKMPGRHLPIRAVTLMDAICVYGHTTTAIALQYEWYVNREVKKPIGQNHDEFKRTVPDRQRKHLFAAIRANINIIGNAWADANMNVPYGIIETE